MKPPKKRFPVLLPDEAAEWDRYSIEEQGVSSLLLMGAAAFSIATDVIKRNFFRKAKKIHFLLGPGNNGGDGYALAYYLASAVNPEVSQKQFRLWQLAPPKTKDARYFYELSQALPGGRVKTGSLTAFLQALRSRKKPLSKKHVVVDALFGTGFSRELDPDLLSLFRLLKDTDAAKIAVDIPSGVFGNGNFFDHPAFPADRTYTFGSYKPGHLLEPGIFHTGKLKVADIGFFPKKDAIFNRGRLAQVRKARPARRANSHKYSSGKLLLLGGSESMEGAAIMAARAFLSTGGGIVRIYTSSPDMKKILRKTPELMLNVLPWQETETNFLKEATSSKAEATTIVIGPGLREFPSRTFWNKLLTSEKKLRVLLDGSVLREELRELAPAFRDSKNCELFMTPHKAEAERVLGHRVDNIRMAAREICEQYNTSVYLKGPGGIIVTPAKKSELYVNSRHKELAVAGTGDIFSGILALRLIHEKTPETAFEAALSLYFAASGKILSSGKTVTPSRLLSVL